MVAKLDIESRKQLRRSVDDRAAVENRRIMEVIRQIEQNALLVRGNIPSDALLEIDEAAPHLDLSMDRPLFNRPCKAQFDGNEIVRGDPNFSSDALFDQVYVDRLRRSSFTSTKNITAD